MSVLLVNRVDGRYQLIGASNDDSMARALAMHTYLNDYAALPNSTRSLIELISTQCLPSKLQAAYDDLVDPAASTPAVIVSDFMMPHMNGAEPGAALRANSAWCDIPFVFSSGTNEEVVQASFADYDRFLPEPINIGLLLSVIADLAANGRKHAPNSRDVSESMRHLLKGIEMPPQRLTAWRCWLGRLRQHSRTTLLDRPR